MKNNLLPLCVAVSCVSALSLSAHAETAPASDPVPGVVLVNDTELYSRLEVMQQTLDNIAAALAEETPAEVATPETAPDYGPQLESIEYTLSKIDENTTPATPETPVSAFDKPFTEYTTTEVLLLGFGVLAIVAGVVVLFLRR